MPTKEGVFVGRLLSVHISGVGPTQGPLQLNLEGHEPLFAYPVAIPARDWECSQSVYLGYVTLAAAAYAQGKPLKVTYLRTQVVGDQVRTESIVHALDLTV